MTGSLTEQQAKEVLKKNTIARIGCWDGKEVYIVPVAYLYYNGNIIGHSHAGKKIRNMRRHPDVCFEVDQVHSNKTWKSVIAWGTYEEISDKTEKWNIMQEFLKKKLYVKSGEAAPVPEISGTRLHPRTTTPIILYKIVIRRLTGRYEVEDQEEML